LNQVFNFEFRPFRPGDLRKTFSFSMARVIGDDDWEFSYDPKSIFEAMIHRHLMLIERQRSDRDGKDGRVISLIPSDRNDRIGQMPEKPMVTGFRSSRLAIIRSVAILARATVNSAHLVRRIILPTLASRLRGSYMKIYIAGRVRRPDGAIRRKRIKALLRQRQARIDLLTQIGDLYEHETKLNTRTIHGDVPKHEATLETTVMMPAMGYRFAYLDALNALALLLPKSARLSLESVMADLTVHEAAISDYHIQADHGTHEGAVIRLDLVGSQPIDEGSLAEHQLLSVKALLVSMTMRSIEVMDLRTQEAVLNRILDADKSGRIGTLDSAPILARGITEGALVHLLDADSGDFGSDGEMMNQLLSENRPAADLLKLIAADFESLPALVMAIEQEQGEPVLAERKRIKDAVLEPVAPSAHWNDADANDIWEAYSEGIDVLDLPTRDYDYTTNPAPRDVLDENGVPYNAYGATNVADVDVYGGATITTHPLPEYSDVGNFAEIPVDTYVLTDIMLFFHHWKKKDAFRYGPMSARDAVYDILTKLKEYIDNELDIGGPTQSEYERGFRHARWYAESILNKHTVYRLRRTYDHWMSAESSGQVGTEHIKEGIAAGGGLFYNTQAAGSLKLWLTNYIDGELIFNARNLAAGQIEVYVDRELRLTAGTGTWLDQMTPVRMGDHVIEFRTQGAVEFSFIRLSGAIFTESVEMLGMDDTISGLGAINLWLQMLLRYYKIHHTKKVKGGRKHWIITEEMR
jgi:hypothetical protein